MSFPRDRSVSPPVQPQAKKSKTTGFKWKDKQARDGSQAQTQDRGLERGYRDRSPRRVTHKDREHQIDSSEAGRFMRKPLGTSRQVDLGSAPDNAPSTRSDLASKFGPQAAMTTSSTAVASPASKVGENPPKNTLKRSARKPPTAPPSDEPMIIVNINDRLGTKAAIPCLASDSVKAFRAIVAAHIGRQPHEIMIKRQGERPFKDVLTLQDYGVSGGVQLDLEIDTGD
nr:ubiquitin-like modifier hub1 [Quercus suber]